jgi:Zn-dependent M28 family amino/carboxypeptidase
VVRAGIREGKGGFTMGESELAEVEHGVIGEIWASGEMQETMETLSLRWPNRLPGTRYELEAAEYLANRMESYGLDNVGIEEFEYEGWDRGKTPSVEVVHPERMSFPCSALIYSPAGKVAGPLEDLGAGTREDFEFSEERLPGSVAIMSLEFPSYRQAIPIEERLRMAAAGGAKAVICREGSAGHLLPGGTASFAGRAAPLPVVGISREDAYRLGCVGNEGQQPVVRVGTHCSVGPAVGYNCVGEIVGNKWPEKVLIASGHYDSIEISPGANDNAAGVASVLEIGRVLAKRRGVVGKTIRLCFFSAEELGMLGSFGYVKQHAEELGKIELVMNLDDPAGDLENGLAVQGWPEMVRFFRELRGEMNASFPVGIKMKHGSDNYPFQVAGVPTISIDPLGKPSGGQGFGHTPAETPDKVSPLKMRLMAVMMGRILLRLASREEWPIGHKSPEEIRDFMEGEGLRERLEQTGIWPQ